MGIRTVHDDGHIHYVCVKCSKTAVYHVSDAQIQYVEDSDMIQLPSCVQCGSIAFLRTTFTSEELQANNLVLYGMVPEQTTLPHAVTGEPIPVLIPAFKPIGANPFIEQHKELVRQLAKVNKHPKKEH